MLSMLIWLAVFCVSVLISQYVFDGPKFPDKPPFQIRRASVCDLPKNAGMSDIDQYEREYVIPSARCISLYKEFTGIEDSSDIFVLLFLMVTPAIFLVRSVFKYFSGTKEVFLYCVVTAAACFLIAKILCKVYEKRFSIPQLGEEIWDLKRYIEKQENHFHIECGLNYQNQMTLIYCSYLMRIQDGMRKRIAFRSVVTWVCAIIYFLFFLRNPY